MEEGADDFEVELWIEEQWEVVVGEPEEAEASPGTAAVAWGSSQPRPLSVVDEAWELLDPIPDVHSLFVEFNDAFFWGLLGGVEVSWSPRMTVSVGVCHCDQKSGTCSIRLSEPLLKLRPRRDLVETLLHEMIHALLFVTNNNKDREPHGPEFRKHMHRINHLSGANVTIRHSFHKEVDFYRQHWWRCNGPCQDRKPYFGYVKRSMNRAPARDAWWAEHQQTCGGTFTKVKEPENFSKKSKGKARAAKRPNSTATYKDKKQTHDTQDLVPFSGKGYRLGGGDSGLSEKSTTSSSSVRNTGTADSPHCSGVGTIPVPKNEIKFEKSPRSGIFQLHTDDARDKINLASKREFPELSVAQTEAYEDVSELPAKIARVTDGKNQGSAHDYRVNPFSDRPPKQVPFEQTTAAQVAPEEEDSECASTLQQWPKTEDQTAFENYFIKKAGTCINTAMKTKAESATSSASSSTAVRQDEIVICPVCQAEVLEPDINRHLDFCLA
ncbi:LOW QUALITY PROTEIN: DNA-dependent metalloprotease SPRTN-like [Leptosomus discolor]